MIFYLGLFCLVVLFSFINTYTKDKNIICLSKMLLFLLLFLPLALREGIGTDYKNYIQIFDNFVAGKPIRQEPGWQLINILVYKLGLNVQWIFIISAFFTVYFVLKTPRKYSFIIVILFYSLYYLEAFNIVRQCLAMSICWYSFLCFNEGKTKKAYLFAFIAVTFHYATLIVVFCYFVMNKVRISDKFFIVLLILSFLVIQSGVFLKILTILLSFTKYGVYVTRLDLFTNLKTGGVGGLTTFAVRSFILLSMYYSLPDTISSKEKNYCKVMTLALFTFDLLGVSLFIVQRVRIFFFLSYMVIFYYIYCRRYSLAKLQNFIYVMFFICYYLLLKLITGSGAIIPYNHI